MKVLLIIHDGMRPDGMTGCRNPYVDALLESSASTLCATWGQAHLGTGSLERCSGAPEKDPDQRGRSTLLLQDEDSYFVLSLRRAP